MNSLYTYVCPTHGEFTSALRADSQHCVLNMSCTQRAQRRWGFSVAKSFQPHFNPSLGVGINSESEFKSHLSRVSEEQSAPQTNYLADGTPVTVERPQHHFTPVDIRDKAALGVTNDGLDATYDRWRQQGRDGDAKKLKDLMDD